MYANIKFFKEQVFNQLEHLHSDFISRQGLTPAKKRYNLKVGRRKINITCTQYGCRMRLPIEFDWNVLP